MKWPRSLEDVLDLPFPVNLFAFGVLIPAVGLILIAGLALGVLPFALLWAWLR